MKLDFNDIIDKHKNKKCLVIGHGVSLNEHLEKLQQYKDEGYIIVGCNNWNEFYPNTQPHYWINANSVDTVKKQIDIINKYNSVWVYADSVDLTSHTWVNENIIPDYLSYDQRHFEGKSCNACYTYGCCKYLSDRLTIQEQLQKYTSSKDRYGTGDTVILHSLAFSILMGCTDIYILGVDLHYSYGYANNNTQRTNPDTFSPYRDNIINDMKIISESSKNIGVHIYNTNKNSDWDNIFEKGSL